MKEIWKRRERIEKERCGETDETEECARNLFVETRKNISFRNSPLAKHTIYFLVPSWNCSLAINTNSKNLFDLLCTS
jgi:hypothetical protein